MPQNLLALADMMILPWVVKEKELHNSYCRCYKCAKKAMKDKFTGANPQDLLPNQPAHQERIFLVDSPRIRVMCSDK